VSTDDVLRLIDATLSDCGSTPVHSGSPGLVVVDETWQWLAAHGLELTEWQRNLLDGGTR